MTGFEDELRRALRREDPPAGFSERVMARIPAAKPGWRTALASLFQVRQFRWALAGTLVVAVMTVGGVRWQQERQFRAEGERARAEVLTALKIASVKLNGARRKVQAIGSGSGTSGIPAADEARKSKI